MWRDFIRIYGKWVLVCLISAIVALGAFAIYYKIQYPRIRMRNYERSFDYIEDLIKRKKWYRDGGSGMCETTDREYVGTRRGGEIGPILKKTFGG
jgi:hypothetical protein